jgi:dienelactone hydrolase
MQNKANLQKAEMSAYLFTTKVYEIFADFRHGKTKPIQTQSQKVSHRQNLPISTCPAKHYNRGDLNLFGGLKMFNFAAITKELTRKLTSHEIPHISLIFSLIIAWLYVSPVQASGSNNDSLEPLNRFPRMVQEYFVKNVRRVEQQADKRRAALKTRVDAQAYVQDVREKIQQSFGPWPEKTPLKSRITGVVERADYKIEKIIFESRPNFLVTANLYVPKGRKFPLPAVVGTCGHSSNGKASELYQSFSQGLARQGYIVLIFDPLGQGERLQYPDENLKSKIGVGVREHLYAGNQQFLVGDFLGSWRAWDGIRALDYLLTRKEVDPKHIGVTGNSGGGTMTTWLCGVENRWTMAAPSCFVITFRRNLANELPADTEQCPPRAPDYHSGKREGLFRRPRC